MHRVLLLKNRRLVSNIMTAATRNNNNNKYTTRFYHQSRLANKKKTSAIVATTAKDDRFFSTVPQETLDRDEKAILSDHPNSVNQLISWPVPYVECNGDYRNETFIEKHIGGPLYNKQDTLPTLPIPTLNETIKRFIPTALPLCTNEEEKQSLLDACNKFPIEAKELQELLLKRKEYFDNNDDNNKNGGHSSSWLQLWWNTLGYLQVRDPIVINVSYFFHFSDDGTLPSSSSSSSSSSSTTENDGYGRNVLRGSTILYSLAEFRKMVITGELPAETIGRKDPKTTLCSTAYKYMFNACRIPQYEQDIYKIYDPSLHSHCIVSRNGQFYSIDLCNKVTGDPLPIDILQKQLQKVIDLADNATSCENNDNTLLLSNNLGYLTGSNRDEWTTIRNELINIGGISMKNALEKIESGAILLCLDNENPISRKDCGELFLHGGRRSTSTSSSSSGSVKNRFYDKSIQIFVTDNGKAGYLGEHSMMDGMPAVTLANHITTTTYWDAQYRSQRLPKENISDDDINVTNIFENVNDIIIQKQKEESSNNNINELITKARNEYDILINNHELNVQSFMGYGSSFMKKSGYSPDAYVQVAMQLATYRLWDGEQGGTYEATQVRPFVHGRTETTRSVSLESEKFVKSMGLYTKSYNEHYINDDKRKEQLYLLQNAINAHVTYISNAAKGYGVDRHFFGLSMISNESDNGKLSLPTLYNHPIYNKSKHWRVSTSHLTHPKFDNWGYGEVVPDGVGLSYGIKSNCCIFNVTCLKKHNWSEKLCHLLEESLLEIKLLIDIENEKSNEKEKSIIPKSKL